MARRTEEYNLKAVNPSLASQWHPTKNDTLRPKDVTPMSNKKVWWKCAEGHEWTTTIANGSKGQGCPDCGRTRVSKEYNLEVANKNVAAQWHPTKNGTLSPKDVTPGSTKKVWWICDKGHEYQARVYNRSKGRGCPYCVGRAVCADNSLQTINPSLAAQWHPKKNGNLSPNDVTPHSNKKVWWFCDNGHEWKALINSRSIGVGCPGCAGRNQ